MRITPAYAGKRTFRKNEPKAWKDHPRVCGEKYFAIRDKVAKKGSPPRMRGKDVFQVLDCQWIRITPAYAGKRRICMQRRLAGRDHPRVCGEKP